ncbi:MAG: proline/betaine transporter [Rickettsia sp.]|uniref:proline/betaine transporter n=1 Tax=Rickettsia sp. TaxID=789 RepID=UPI003979F59F
MLHGPVKPTVSPRGLTTGSIKTIKNTNNFSIFNWIPWTSHGITLKYHFNTQLCLL